MSELLPESYWTSRLQVAREDLDAIAEGIRTSGQARDLTTLARGIVKGRLQSGEAADLGERLAWGPDPSVRLWDPAGHWSVGDHIIVARRVTREQFEAAVGEIIDLPLGEAVVQLDGLEQAVRYRRARSGSRDAKTWYETVRQVVADKLRGATVEERADAVLLTHGETVVSQLLGALQRDRRFVQFGGRWFLRDLMVAPTEEQIAAVAWKLAMLDEPQPIEALLPMRVAQDDAMLFGFSLALTRRTDLFANRGPSQRPSWVLIAPPTGGFVAKAGAYDPDSFRVLCVAGEAVGPDVAARLWEAGLLRAVVPAPRSSEPMSPEVQVPYAVRAGHRDPGGKGRRGTSGQARERSPGMQETPPRAASRPGFRPVGGDARFVREAPAELRPLCEALLAAVRKECRGRLSRGKSGIYVETPDAFWSVRAQPRARNLRIHLRGEPYTFDVPKDIVDLKADRRSYSRFTICRIDQVPSAVRLIQQTRRRGEG